MGRAKKNGVEDDVSDGDPGRDQGREEASTEDAPTEEDKDIEEQEVGPPRSRAAVGRGTGGSAPKLTRSQVAKKLQISPATVKRWVREKKLHPVQDLETKVWWFDAEEVEDVMEEEQGGDVDAKQVLGVALSQCHKHIETLMLREQVLLQTFIDGLTKSAERDSAAVTRAYERVTQLEVQRQEAIDQVEAAKTMETERNLMMMRQVHDQDQASLRAKQISNAGAMIMTYAGPTIMKKMGMEVPKDVNQKGADILLRQLMSTIQPDQVEKLAKAGALTEDQLALVGRAWSLMKQEADEAAKAEQAPAPEGKPS